MNKEDKSKKEKHSAYTSVVTDYKHKCKDCLCSELHVNPKSSAK